MLLQHVFRIWNRKLNKNKFICLFLDLLQSPEIEFYPPVRVLKNELLFQLRKTKLYTELYNLAVKEYYRKPDLEVLINICLNDVYLDLVD